ncbi:hypothetical protein M9H77_08771 [Catharanthus roseus]|uniref:Uncharacterized protein n=1 Tax=Catharanthus roseus TaxID=4058 RepID=A0ACC0BYS5_CATRO|nr:hypothetical protein M9H77_08771 [Catharanthus roseus]
MIRTWPYVLIMDTTYKTNKYNMPLLEAVGMTPTGKNFTVATAFIRHIDQNVLAKLTEMVQDEEVAQWFVNGSWKKLINEIDEEEYKRKLEVLKSQIAEIKYSLEISKLKEKFAAKSNAILKNISNKIRHLTLKKIWLEIKKAREMVEDSGKIGVDIPNVYERDMNSEMHDVTLMLEEISIGPISKVRKVRRLIKGVIFPVLPEDPCPPLTNPPEIAVTKGRRKTNSTKRDKSHWEYVSIAHRKIGKSSGSGSESGSGLGSGSCPSP